MKYAIIADIHGNLDALEVVLEDIRQQQVTNVVCLGDVVGYNARPKECLDIIRSMNIPCVKGNHDEYCSAEDILEGFNPLAAEAQVQGAAIFGFAMTQPGFEITLKDGVVQQSQFTDFTPPRMTEAFPVAVHFVPSQEAPTGLGEPGVPAIAPAVANAVAVLTGKRLRKLPFDLTA